MISNRILLKKIYNLTNDTGLTQIIKALHQHKRFYVTLRSKKSRQRLQKNGLPQGNVLAPILFNIYTNNQPITPGARYSIYADDTATAIQNNNFEEVETRLKFSLKIMKTYYKQMKLKPNPTKTYENKNMRVSLEKQVQATRKIYITWGGVKIENSTYPKYLGVTLDRPLTFEEHCVVLKRKICQKYSTAKIS